jgi:hypothetical protein
MAAWQRAIELSLGDEDTAKLKSIAQSRTEPASRVERARILLAHREDPSFFAVGRALGLHHQTSPRTVDDAASGQPRSRAWARGRACVSCHNWKPRKTADSHSFPPTGGRRTLAHLVDDEEVSVLATRKPMKMLRSSVRSRLRRAARRPAGKLYQEPPRLTRNSQSPDIQGEPSEGAPT